ncbi:MAG TPA: DUF72 domain-containing protein [Chloroflexota bacterium]|jgi:uncharacterized protein YecE (DUF72 family)|nr:DUF72 domain-containing protein [Chloroflexota bacterium]
MNGRGSTGAILTGTCSWTDKTLVESGWYGDASTPEQRLARYAEAFNVVEVDSTYYSLPSEKTAELWAERTPVTFTFDVKAFRLLTGHPAELTSLPKDLRGRVPADIQEKKKLYLKDLPREMSDELWKMFRQALMPLHSAGKLGVVLFQFPAWFFPGRNSHEYLARITDCLPEYRIAVEFRHGSWLNEKNQSRTFDLLREHRFAYTSVDEPQGTRQSVPPIAVATSDIAIVRFHGRRAETWDKANVGVLERFKYLYSQDELMEWLPKIKELAAETREVHALMNNCYSDFAVTNATQLAALLKDD